MSRIKGKDSKQEMTVRKFLFANGYRYRLHNIKLPGRPDITLTKYKCVVMVNGCFWHGHDDCRFSKMPATHRKYWKEKISRNKERDKKAIMDLNKMGFKVIVVWQCQLSSKEKSKITLEFVGNQINMATIRRDPETSDRQNALDDRGCQRSILPFPRQSPTSIF